MRGAQHYALVQPCCRDVVACRCTTGHAAPVALRQCCPAAAPHRVRHEAGEALGAIGTEECLAPLREHLQVSGCGAAKGARTQLSCLLPRRRCLYTHTHHAPLPSTSIPPPLPPPQDPCQEVAHTCQLALQRIEFFAAAAAAAAADADPNAVESKFYSVDPTPAAPASTPLPQLRDALLSEGEPIFQR